MQAGRPKTIGILTPYAGGQFYTSILHGVQRVARARGARVVAFQTNGMDLSVSAVPGSRPLGLDVVDGFIAAADFDVPAYARAIAAAKKPLVYLSARPSELACCTVLPDNVGGTRAAVRHLLEHGHRRIGFVGCLEQLDIQERHAAYVQTLHAAGLEPDRKLFFPAAGNLELDGREVGEQLLAQKLPCTAIYAATDKNALGIIEVVTAAGHRVPEELAVVGFDDIELAQYAEPPLSTVRQRFDLLAERAAEALLASLNGSAPLPDVVRVSTVFVARGSCGCSPVPDVALAPLPDREAALAQSLLALAGSERRLSPLSAEAWPGARRIAALVCEAVEGRSAAGETSLTDVWDGFFGANPGVESLEAVIAVLEGAASRWSSETPGDCARKDELSRVLRRLRLELLRAWRSVEHARHRYYEFLAEAKRRITLTLMGTDFAAARGLSWLRWTRVRHACLALYRDGDGAETRELELVGTFSAEGAQKCAEGAFAAEYPAAAFPPRSLHELVESSGPDGLVTVVPITNSGKRQGLLAVVAPVETEVFDHLGSLGDWASMLSAALAREQLLEVLRENALHDALTGLPNRALLMERLEHAIVTARRKPECGFAVLFIDLDHFKNVNDSLGHLAGDELLVGVAGRLKRALRATDMVARLGGDEFAILVSDVATESDAARVVLRIQDALRAPFQLEDTPVFVSLSIGVTLSSAAHECAEDFLRDSDSAMYRAKREGRSRYEVSQVGMQAAALERLKLEARVRQALDAGEFTLHYQPQVSLITSRVAGVEALIRWNDKERGCLPPSAFLRVAEETELVIPLSEWVIRRACEDARRFQRAYRAPVPVSINLPAQHLKHPDLVPFIRRTLAELELLPEALSIELVESSLIENSAPTLGALAELSELGIGIAIDDFGTGYSSLGYLQRLRADSLKIDKSFTQGVESSEQDATICGALVALARSLGLRTVAEGIETRGQLEFFRARGCDYVQGYLLCPPLPVEQCEGYLRKAGAYASGSYDLAAAGS